MRKAAILALILLSAACNDRAPPGSSAASETAPAPIATAAPASPSPAASPSPDPAAEVARLTQRIEACQHSAGEEPYDAARAAELRKQVEANCPGNGEELKRLRGKYAADRKVTRQLEELAQQAP